MLLNKKQAILKTSAYIVFILLTLFQSTGLYLVHSMQVGFVRHEMKQRIKHGVPEEQRVVIKITPEIENNTEKFTRIHSREFRFLGEMYDVLTTETSGDTTLYTCIHDVKESGLFNDLDRLVNQQINYNPDERESRELAFSFFNQHYLPFVEPLRSEHGIEVSIVFSPNHDPLLGFSSEQFRPPIG